MDGGTCWLFTDTFAGFNDSGTGEIDGIVLYIEQTDYLLDFPMPKTASYNVQ